jgi:hypothetical protein
MTYENFPTPEEIAPKIYAAPPLDEKWAEKVMNEIASLLRRNQVNLRQQRDVRFIPTGRRDMGHALQQWKHFASQIADLVRESGWQVILINSDTVPTLLISLPEKGKPR